MRTLWLLVFLVFHIGFLSKGISDVSTRPRTVNIGAILSFNSTIGKVAKVAIEAAVNDINSNSAVLSGTMLNISMQDTKVSTGFLGIIGCKSLSKLSRFFYFYFFKENAYLRSIYL